MDMEKAYGPQVSKEELVSLEEELEDYFQDIGKRYDIEDNMLKVEEGLLLKESENLASIVEEVLDLGNASILQKGFSFNGEGKKEHKYEIYGR